MSLDAGLAAALRDHGLYALLWLSFGVVHSALAHQPLRRVWKALFGRSARLAYNLLSTVHIAAVLAAAPLWLFADPRFAAPGWAAAAQAVVAAAGLFLLLVAARHYDMGRFLGLRQLTQVADATDDDEPLRTDGLHARLRHPLYAAGLLILWGLASDEAGLATAVWGTLYFLIGAQCEERRLIALFGDAYRDYRQRVPAFLPRLF